MDLTLNETRHPVVNLILAPIWGLSFLMFLPAIGFVLVIQAILKPLFSVRLASPVTGAAYLTGTEATDHPTSADALGAVADEVSAQRAKRS